jgi:hypothetical protein
MTDARYLLARLRSMTVSEWGDGLAGCAALAVLFLAMMWGTP